MGKKAKEHRKKVAKRNAKIQESNKRREKYAMDFLREMIEKEKAGGAFNGEVQPLPGETPGEAPPIAPNPTEYTGPQI